MGSPKISIITCLYNTEPEHFQKCILSMVNQTFKDWECIIFNDGSDKYIEENIKFIASFNDQRFRIFKKDHNGKSNTLNMALQIAKGKYCAIWDSDDQFIRERLEYQYEWLESHPEYDVLSNELISKNKQIWPGFRLTSTDINKYNCHYLGHHPSQMFNRVRILLKVPYLFEQVYDSMEDNIFNHIMLYYGCKMRFEAKIIGEYNISRLDAAHLDNLHGYLKYCTFNLIHKTFDYNVPDAPMTCILHIDENWGNELEKTLMNIRLTSNNVNIIVVNTSDINSVYPTICDRYKAEYIQNINYNYGINSALEKTTSNYIFYINNPIRICTENWDFDILKLMQFGDTTQQNAIIQPILFDMEKVGDNEYLNQRGKYEKHNIRYGERLLLIQEELSENIENDNRLNDYFSFVDIPLINKDLCFICKRDILKEAIKGFDNDSLLNIIISIKSYLNYKYKSLLYYDMKCSVISPNVEKNFNYYKNYVKIIKLLFNETLAAYEHILHNNISDNLFNSVLDNINHDSEYNQINLHKDDLSSFLKNINMKQSWIV